MPLNNPRLFVSYSRDDSAFAERLATDLRARGVNIWFDRLDIRTGAHWDMEVEAGLKASQGVLVILSPTSVASQNVMDEVSFAMGDGKRILPVLYQPCAIPLRLARLQYIDFVDSYDEGLERLVTDLATPSTSTRPAAAPTPEAPRPGRADAGPRASAPSPRTPVALAPARGALPVGKLAAGGVGALVLLVLVFRGGASDAPTAETPDDSPSVESAAPVTDDASPAPAPGTVHPEHPHVVVDVDGQWRPKPGYDWVDAAAPADLRVVWKPGLAHRDHPNVLAAEDEATWATAPGYEWVNPDDPGDLSVRPSVRPLTPKS